MKYKQVNEEKYRDYLNKIPHFNRWLDFAHTKEQSIYSTFLGQRHNKAFLIAWHIYYISNNTIIKKEYYIGDTTNGNQ